MIWNVLKLVSVLICAAGLASAEGRFALVIGNSDYDNVGYLPNATNDARDVAAALRSIGFVVTDGYDLPQSKILELAQTFQRALSPDDVALFYFSGHGVQIGSENFIIPVDAFGTTADMLRGSSVSLQTILAGMERSADRNVIVLDACRNNPFELDDATRSLNAVTRGLAEVDAGVGSYIAFSTQPGNVALDGAGDNSPFTEALVRHVKSGSDDLHAVMRKVRGDVVTSTSSSQIPWENSSLIDQIFLAEPYGRRGATPAAAPTPQQAPEFTYRVEGLNPQGDGFLALRSLPTTDSTMLARMTEGTRLEFLQQRGIWFNVRTDTGLEGWAHGNWVRFVGRQTSIASTSPPPMTCDDLWYARNAIFARNGYCFQGARGQATFGNAGCRQGVAAGDIPLSARERADVEYYVARESALQCR